MAENVVHLPLDRLRVAETNPRKTQAQFSPSHGPLMASIRAQGVMVPLIVVPNNGHFDVICGYRRMTAARALRLETVPCIVRPLGRLAQLELGLTDNINRGAMDPVDIGLALAAMADEGLTQTQIAKHIGRSAFYVSRYIRIAALPAAVRKQIKAKKLTMGAALGPTAGIPRAAVFQADEDLQRAWLELRETVIASGDRQVTDALKRFAGCWRAFGKAKQAVVVDGVAS